MELWERSRDKTGPFCCLQPLCHGWPHPPGRPGPALKHSRTLGPAHTSCHCCLLHRPGTDTAHCTAWTTYNSATFNWPTIGRGAWQSDWSPTASHSTGRFCITPVVVLVVVPLLVVVSVTAAAAVVCLLFPSPVEYNSCFPPQMVVFWVERCLFTSKPLAPTLHMHCCFTHKPTCTCLKDGNRGFCRKIWLMLDFFV